MFYMKRFYPTQLLFLSQNLMQVNISLSNLYLLTGVAEKSGQFRNNFMP